MKLITKIAIALLSTSAAVDAFSSISQSKTARVIHINLYSCSRDLDTIQSITDGKIDKQSKIQRIQQFGLATWERMDTMKAAGLTNDPELVPMNAGFKTNVGLLVGAFLFKWYRARFVTKIPVWDRQPQWNTVVTSPEQEKELHAYECKNCGATIFIARHREWFFKGGNTECTNCGATGKDNFMDIREDVIEEIDDDYFDYPSPLDYVSAAEKRRLVKEAGGDEILAKKIAIEKTLKEDPKQVQVEPTAATSTDDDGSAKEENEKKAAPKESEAETPKKSAPKKKQSDDILDELDMDF